jgi:purine-binding chemotaxis protein CheW
MESTNLNTNNSENIINAAYKGYKDGTVNFIGNQVEILTGYSKDVFNSKEKKWLDIILEEDMVSMQETFINALKINKNYMRKYRVRKKTGDVIWIQEWGQIVCDDQGEIEYVTGILLDITEQKKIEEANLKAEALTGKYLIFNIDNAEYGISISKIKEIIGVMPITQIPQTPSTIKGVINLRGKVIPVIDLRLRFGMEEKAYQDRTCIIVVEIDGNDGQVIVGIVVDTVSEVKHIKGNEIEDKPIGLQFDVGDIILGMAKINESVMIILDIDRLFIDEEIRWIKQSA